jgi:hypothetical protein
MQLTQDYTSKQVFLDVSSLQHLAFLSASVSLSVSLSLPQSLSLSLSAAPPLPAYASLSLSLSASPSPLPVVRRLHSLCPFYLCIDRSIISLSLLTLSWLQGFAAQ